MLSAAELSGSVMNKPGTMLENSGVMLELARPMFPTIRVIAPLFTKMKAISIEASVSMMMISEQRILGDSRGGLGRIVKGMMMAG